MPRYQFFLYRIINNEKVVYQSSEILEILDRSQIILLARKFFFECSCIRCNKHPHEEYFVYVKIIENGYSLSTEPLLKGKFNFSRLIHDITYLVSLHVQNMNNRIEELEESI